VAFLGQLVAHVAALGTEAITGKPDKPTTQGKNERFHQTLFRYLDKQPLADTLAELQAQTTTWFSRFDKNNDKVVTKDEIQAQRAAHGGGDCHKS